MDDLNFRRRLYANPSDNSPEIQSACQADNKKSEFRREMTNIEQKMQNALAVKAPTNLAEKILLNQSMVKTNNYGKNIAWGVGLAAGFALFSLTFITKLGLDQSYDDIGAVTLAHVHAESVHQTDKNSYTLAELNSKLSEFGFAVQKEFANVNFANVCYFAGVKSLHLVLESDSGPVTVFLMPKNDQFAFRNQFEDNLYKGTASQLTPANVIVISDSHQNSLYWQHKITTQFEWQKT